MSLAGHVHAIHLRVNLAELDDIEHGSLMRATNRRPSQISSLSLPTYESLDSRSVRCTTELCTPPPSYDQLPSYNEALKDLMIKSEESRTKGDSNGLKNCNRVTNRSLPPSQDAS